MGQMFETPRLYENSDKGMNRDEGSVGLERNY